MDKLGYSTVAGEVNVGQHFTAKRLQGSDPRPKVAEIRSAIA